MCVGSGVVGRFGALGMIAPHGMAYSAFCVSGILVPHAAAFGKIVARDGLCAACRKLLCCSLAAYNAASFLAYL